MKKLVTLLLIFVSCIAFSQGSLNLNLLGSLDYPNADGNDIWGWKSQLGSEYALVGLTTGFSVVDVSIPSNPIEQFYIQGANSTWRDIKTWNNYAYVTTEGGGGLLIVDLSDMTGNTYSYFEEFDSAHNIYIDENGVAYIFGSNISNGGVLFYDVNSDPWNPQLIGSWEDEYVHDGMARGDTLWLACIYAGVFYGVDVSDKSNPINLGSHPTPNNFSHNIWISDDGNYVFTTDEVSGGYLGAYDISDMSNITEVDRIQSSPGGGVVPHNTHVDGNFIVTSYYTDGTVVHDVTYPNNMVEVAYYDSYSGAGAGFNGCWGTYPFLDSDIIISSEMNSGPNGAGQLLIFNRDYQQACYLEGNVTDASNGSSLINANVEILTTSITSNTNLLGNYNTGVASSGNYQVIFSMPGYVSQTLQATLTNGIVTVLDAQLNPMVPFSMNGVVLDGTTKIEDAYVILENNDFVFETMTNQNGGFGFSTIYESTYNVTVGKWGYITYCGTAYVSPTANTLTINLLSGYYDDFSFDFGWMEDNSTATSGFWERGIPNGTTYNGQIFNPEVDASGDCGQYALVTGNLDSGSAGTDDIDDGMVDINSPEFDLTSYETPYIKFSTWFANGGGGGNPPPAPNDSMIVLITDAMGNMVTLKEKTVNNLMYQWEETLIKIEDYIMPTSQMHLVIKATDSNPGHLVEAGFDSFQIIDSASVSINEFLNNEILVYPNPIKSTLFINVESNTKIKIIDIQGRELITNQLKIGQNSIDVSCLLPGIYMLISQNKHSIKSQSIVKL